MLTQAEYAAHRGCSAVAVHKAVKAGRISLIDSKIDPAVADIQWAQNTRARVSAQPGASTAPPVPVADGVPAEVEAPSADKARPGDNGYWDARTRREQAEASIAERKNAEDAGLLIRVEAVRQVMGNAYATTREAILNIPARLAPKLAPLTDPADIQRELYLELHAALSTLAVATNSQGAVPPTAPDGGAAE